MREDWRDDAGKAATTPQALAAQALEPFGTRFAICNCLYGAQAPFSEDLGVAFARAVNDWIAREWLDRDSAAARLDRRAAAEPGTRGG